MARKPRVSARTPMLAQAQVSSTSAPMVATGGFAHSSQSEDAVAAQPSAPPAPTGPTAEELIDQSLNTTLRNAILDMIAHTVNMWRLQAYFSDLTINASSVTGNVGCLKGPRLIDLKASAPGYHSTDGVAREVVDMCLRGVSENFQLWQHYLFVPGLPLYPAFMAFPGPFAPPMPNVPAPLALFPSGQISQITAASSLAHSIKQAAPDGMESPGLAPFVENIGQCCATAFQIFQTSQLVMGMMGQGPIPSFSPGRIPVGPVIGGTVTPAPGCFLSSSSFTIPRLPIA